MCFVLWKHMTDNLLLLYFSLFVVFNCSAMANGDCNRCLSLQHANSTAKFGCQWCGSVCQPNVSQCASLSSDQTRCPRATVTSVSACPFLSVSLCLHMCCHILFSLMNMYVYIYYYSCPFSYLCMHIAVHTC